MSIGKSDEFSKICSFLCNAWLRTLYKNPPHHPSSRVSYCFPPRARRNWRSNTCATIKRTFSRLHQSTQRTAPAPYILGRVGTDLASSHTGSEKDQLDEIIEKQSQSSWNDSLLRWNETYLLFIVHPVYDKENTALGVDDAKSNRNCTPISNANSRTSKPQANIFIPARITFILYTVVKQETSVCFKLCEEMKTSKQVAWYFFPFLFIRACCIVCRLISSSARAGAQFTPGDP